MLRSEKIRSSWAAVWERKGAKTKGRQFVAILGVVSFSVSVFFSAIGLLLSRRWQRLRRKRVKGIGRENKKEVQEEWGKSSERKWSRRSLGLNAENLHCIGVVTHMDVSVILHTGKHFMWEYNGRAILGMFYAWQHVKKSGLIVIETVLPLLKPKLISLFPLTLL